MDDTIDAVKKYWPWALGALAGFFILSKMGGGGSTSTDYTGTLYDPNLLANNLAMAQVAAGVQSEITQAEAQNNLAGWATMSAGLTMLGNINSDFQQGQIAAYGAIRDQSIAAMDNAADIVTGGLQAGSQSTSQFFNMVGQSNQAAGQMVSAIALAMRPQTPQWHSGPYGAAIFG